MSDGTFSRREVLRRTAGGFPLLALYGLLADRARAESSFRASAIPHGRARARSVIFLFMGGGPSQVDLFDPKPALARYDQVSITVPEGVGTLRDARDLKPLASPWTFRQHGESGIWLSELLPNLGECVDDVCVIRSVYCDQIEHSAAIRLLLTGAPLLSRPSLGSWTVYGLGSENESLPGFVCLGEQSNLRGTAIYGSSFLPSLHQGTHVPASSLKKKDEPPIADLEMPVPQQIQASKIRAINRLNALHRETRAADSRLEARIASYELAFRMQLHSPVVFDLSQETQSTLDMYGVGHADYDNPETPCFAQQCLLARRLVERGVRFVMCNVNNRWDAHGNIRGNHGATALQTDRPVAALLKDLKQRGLLDETLVVWAGEFGRTPQTQGADGRDHHPYGFSAWMAGGGVKGGLTYGATDDFGFYAVENKVHFHDLQATILHLLGLDHTRLTYHYSGRDFRLTDVFGNVVSEVIV
ncbi:MAG: DUF1501 domain-containing protein [Planctomycetaceae bacterium]